MSPWKLLDLTADADTRSIKRRYAQLLKQARPDDDPEAFQRLREAYEQALDWANRRADAAACGDVDADHELESEPASEPASTRVEPPALALLTQAAPRESVEQAWLRRLAAADADLDALWGEARERQQQRAFQLALLNRCQQADGRTREALHWAMQRLDWLSPWQADYLPVAATQRLAERRLAEDIAALHEALPQLDENAFFARVSQLAGEKWLQPLELNRLLQQALVPLLEHFDATSQALLDELASVFGWSERSAHLPCEPARWERLQATLERRGRRAALAAQLRLPAPHTAEQRATWFLFKPLGAARRRRMADAFGGAEWQACAKLAHEVEVLEPTLAQGLEHPYHVQWRRWLPLAWGGWAALFVWLLAMLVLLVDQLYQSAAEGELALLRGLGLALGGSLLVTAILVIAERGLRRLARLLAGTDVHLSRLLLPAAWHAGGSGLLLLRHLVPAALLSLLVSAWAEHLPGPLPALLSLATFAGSAAFLAAVTRGAVANRWLQGLPRRLGLQRWLLPLLGVLAVLGVTTAAKVLIR